MFMSQEFQIYFFQEDKEKVLQEEEEEQKSNLIGIKSSMPRDEFVYLKERINNNLFVMGEFLARDIVSNSVCQDDFTDIDQSNVRKHHTNNKTAGMNQLISSRENSSPSNVTDDTSSIYTGSASTSQYTFT